MFESDGEWEYGRGWTVATWVMGHAWVLGTEDIMVDSSSKGGRERKKDVKHT